MTDPSVDALHARLRPELKSLRAYQTPAQPPPTKLDANESPWSLPAEARSAIGAAVAALDLNRYPDGRAHALRRALATHLGTTPEALVTGVGSDEAIAMVVNAFAGSSDGAPSTVLYPGPSFVMYDITARNHGLRPVDVPMARRGVGYALDLDAMSAAFERERPSVAFYASPNNPTGETFDEAPLRALIERFGDTLHVIDEAYAPFDRPAPSAPARTRGGWADEYANVAVLGTLSKIGLAGLRVGWLRTNPSLAAELEKVRQPFNLNAPGQVIARLLLEDFGDVLDAQVARIVEGREALRAGLETLGIVCAPSSANFLLAQIPKELQAPLLAEGVAIRFFSDPRLDGLARITVGTPEEHTCLFDALRRVRG